MSEPFRFSLDAPTQFARYSEGLGFPVGTIEDDGVLHVTHEEGYLLGNLAKVYLEPENPNAEPEMRRWAARLLERLQEGNFLE